MVRWLYNLCFPLVLLALLPAYLRRMVRRGNFRRHFWQRLGYFSPEIRSRLAAASPPIWVQAVSVGEMLVAVKLVAALRERAPGLPLIVTTTTTTGYQLAQERLGNVAAVLYTPIDLAGAVRRTFDVLRPSQLVIVDGGLWPNQLWEAQRRKIPTALVNARLSPRSERRFRRFRAVTSSMFRLLDLVCVPEAGDAVRWEDLGVAAHRIQHTGSIKFDDAAADASAPDPVEPLERYLRQVCPRPDARVLLAGSTHPGEERVIAEVFLKLRPRIEGLFLIIAPRHVERTPEIGAELLALGLRVATRTAGTPGAADLLLLNTTGELRAWYALATVVFIGKSLLGIGGQNPAEAVSAGKPVIFGPHMENFADLTRQLLAANAAIQVRDAADLEEAAARLLAAPDERERLARAAAQQIAMHRSAGARTAALLVGAKGNFA